MPRSIKPARKKTTREDLVVNQTMQLVREDAAVSAGRNLIKKIRTFPSRRKVRIFCFTLFSFTLMFAVLAAAGRKLHAKACRQEAEACQCKAQHPGTVHAGLRESGCMAVGGCRCGAGALCWGICGRHFCRLSGGFRRLRRFFRGHRRFRHRGGGRLVRRFRNLQLLLQLLHLLQHLVQTGFTVFPPRQKILAGNTLF